MPTPNVLPAPTGLTTNYFGDSGGSTAYYYWVQAIYPSGRSSFAGPVLATGPAGLSSNNVVLLKWNPSPGAIAYDVIRTTTTALTVGTGTVGLVQGLSRNSYTDTGVTLVSYVLQLGGATNQVGAGFQMNVAHAIYTFAADGGTVGLITPVQTAQIPDNAIVIGGFAHPSVALTSGGAATIAIGTSAGSAANSLKAATAVASYSLDAILALTPVLTAATAFKMTAAGNITITVATADLTGGTLEIFVFYLTPTL